MDTHLNRARCFTALLVALTTALLWLPTVARANVVDASKAEAAFKRQDYKAAREQFAALFEQFRTQPSKDSDDFKTYREAAYIFDRMADCCFTQRDWEGLKHYTDGLLVVAISERNLTEAQLRGALYSGIARATADYLAERLDESVRFTTIIQLKRSIALALYESKGEGKLGAGAITQYQALAQAVNGVLDFDKGYIEVNVPVLTQRLDQVDQVYQEVQRLGDMAALWEKYPPASSKTNSVKP
jgi:hypothetical protein